MEFKMNNTNDGTLTESGFSDVNVKVLIYKCRRCNVKFFDNIAYNQHLEVKHGKLSPKQQRAIARGELK